MAKHVFTVVGARPQFVKAAVVSRAMQDCGIVETLVHTGQHHDASMSDVFFAEMGIPAPAFNLGISGRSHGAQTGAMLAAVEATLLGQTRMPDWVLVYGDTNSTLAGALAAAKLHIPIAHVEAGLRSFNRKMPEEINRVMTDHLSALAFCPTEDAVANLKLEGIGEDSGHRCDVLQVGDVMLDAAKQFNQIAMSRADPLKNHGGSNVQFVLATIHRAENTDDPERLRVIFDALAKIAKQMRVVLPLHPRTQKCLHACGLDVDALARVEGIAVLPPLGYLDMLALESRAFCIVTDSGGVQKEAYFAGVPCVTLRFETEWIELVKSGWNVLAPPVSSESIFDAVLNARPGDQSVAFYGDGTASQRISSALCRDRRFEPRPSCVQGSRR